MGTHPHNFVGDYFYQDARRDYIDLEQLAERMKWVLTMTKRNRPQMGLPQVILILRNGLSEGQFARVGSFFLLLLVDLHYHLPFPFSPWRWR